MLHLELEPKLIMKHLQHPMLKSKAMDELAEETIQRADRMGAGFSTDNQPHDSGVGAASHHGRSMLMASESSLNVGASVTGRLSRICNLPPMR